MISKVLSFYTGKLFLSTAPFSIFNDQYFSCLLLVIYVVFLVFVPNSSYFTEHLHVNSIFIAKSNLYFNIKKLISSKSSTASIDSLGIIVPPLLNKLATPISCFLPIIFSIAVSNKFE